MDFCCCCCCSNVLGFFLSVCVSPVSTSLSTLRAISESFFIAHPMSEYLWTNKSYSLNSFSLQKLKTQVSLLMDIKFRVIMLKLCVQFPGSKLPLTRPSGQLPSVVREHQTAETFNWGWKSNGLWKKGTCLITQWLTATFCLFPQLSSTPSVKFKPDLCQNMVKQLHFQTLALIVCPILREHYKETVEPTPTKENEIKPNACHLEKKAEFET